MSDAFLPVIARQFDADYQVQNQSGDFCGFVGKNGQPLFVALWDGINADNLLAPDGSTASAGGATGLWDAFTDYPDGTVGSQLQFLTPFANLATGSTNILVVDNGAGEVNFDTSQDISTASSPAWAAITVAGITTTKYLVDTLGLPTVNLGAGAGTGATVTKTGSGRKFRLDIVAGTGATVSGATIAQVIYAAFANPPVVTLTPANPTAIAFNVAQAGGVNGVQTSTPTVNGFLIIAGGGTSTGYVNGATYSYTVDIGLH